MEVDAELAEVGDAGVLRAYGLHRAVRRCAVEVYKGSGWVEGHRRQGIARRSVFTRVGASRDSGDAECNTLI